MKLIQVSDEAHTFIKDLAKSKGKKVWRVADEVVLSYKEQLEAQPLEQTKMSALNDGGM